MSLESERKNDDEREIRHRIEKYVQAIRVKDLERVMLIFAPTLVSFDLESPLQHFKPEAKRSNWSKAFSTYIGPIEYEVRDLTLLVDRDLAVGRSVNRISGTLSDGKKVSYWVRWTTCFQKIDGAWLIVHDHVSVPLDLKTGKGVLDIEP
jgi:ketosteroid isomerase-like protein